MRITRTASSLGARSYGCFSLGLLALVCACSSGSDGTPQSSSQVNSNLGDQGFGAPPLNPPTDNGNANGEPSTPAPQDTAAPPSAETNPAAMAPVVVPEAPDNSGASNGAGGGSAQGGSGGMGTGEPPDGMNTDPPTDPPSETPETPTLSGPVTLFLAGDSIVQSYVDTASDRDQAGWGQMLGARLSSDVSVDNRAIGGRTARRFIDEGRLDELVADLLPDDYLLVQFGTNDSNRTATYVIGDQTIPYFLDPATEFKTYLTRYVDAARGRGAIPIFVTPTPRNSAYCTGGNGTGNHAQAMRELGQALSVGVVDLNAQSVAYLQAICPAPTPENFFLLRADGTVDGTHFQENGARILAGFVANGLATAAPELAGTIR